jgi:hypothetical protein
MRLLRGKFGLYMPKFEKINSPNPLCNVFALAFILTLFLSSFCPDFGLLNVLTPFFLQVSHLRDASEETRVIAGILENFENFLYFCKFHMTLGLKTEFLKPRYK